MNRKNLTAAVLAGLAGVAGMATADGSDKWYLNAYEDKIEIVLPGGNSCVYEQSVYGRINVPRDGEVILTGAQYDQLIVKEDKDQHEAFYITLADTLKEDCEAKQ